MPAHDIHCWGIADLLCNQHSLLNLLCCSYKQQHKWMLCYCCCWINFCNKENFTTYIHLFRIFSQWSSSSLQQHTRLYIHACLPMCVNNKNVLTFTLTYSLTGTHHSQSHCWHTSQVEWESQPVNNNCWACGVSELLVKVTHHSSTPTHKQTLVYWLADSRMSNPTHFFYALVVCMKNNKLVESGTPEMSKSQAATQRKSMVDTHTYTHADQVLSSTSKLKTMNQWVKLSPLQSPNKIFQNLKNFLQNLSLYGMPSGSLYFV